MTEEEQKVISAAMQAGFMLHSGYGQGTDKMMPVSDAATPAL